MCLCYYPHGCLLVHRGPTTGCHSTAPGTPFSSVWHHAVQRCKKQIYCIIMENFMLSRNEFLSTYGMPYIVCDSAIPGVYAVPEGYKHVVCWRIDGCRSGGTLESTQTHCVEGVALCWCASSTVSSSHRLSILVETFRF